MIIFGLKKKTDTEPKEKKVPKKTESKVEPEEKTEEEKLKEKYGVTKDIPERLVKEEGETFKHIIYPKEEGEVGLYDLILRIEKMDGKLDIIDRFRNDMNERVTQLAEEIGELRTMILDRERSFDKISTEFEKIKDNVSDLEPGRIKGEFDKKENKILENKVKIEKIENLIKALGEENKKYRKLMEKIKSFENLMNISYDMDRRISKIEEVKNHADMIASKVENIFSELNEKVSELEGQREKIEKLDELTIEMTKMLDEISVRLSRFMEKKDLNEFKKDVEKEVDKLKKSLQVRVPIPTGKIPVVKPSPVVQRIPPGSDLSQVYSQFSKLRSVVDSQNTVINNILQRIRTGGAESENQDLRNVMLSLRFFQIMNVLLYIKKPEKIKDYLIEIKELAEEMKSNGIWNEEKNYYMRGVLDKLSRSLGSVTLETT
jgi:hypothetical protein